MKVDTLYRAIRDSQAAESIPLLLQQIIQNEMWREHLYEKTGETYRFDSFLTFVETHPPDGLGSNLDKLFRLCVDSPSTIELLDQTVQDTFVLKEDEKVKKPAVSSARQAGLRRLRRHAEIDEKIASLRELVLCGEMTLNSALIQAGLRKPRITIPKDIIKATAALRRIYSTEQLNELIEGIKSDRVSVIK